MRNDTGRPLDLPLGVRVGLREGVSRPSEALADREVGLELRVALAAVERKRDIHAERTEAEIIAHAEAGAGAEAVEIRDLPRGHRTGVEKADDAPALADPLAHF